MHALWLREIIGFSQYLLSDRSGNHRNLDRGEIASEVGAILDAGPATTAIALNNVMYWLLRNITCLARLCEEVDAALESTYIVSP